MGRFIAHSTRLPGTAQIRAKADHYKWRKVLSNLQMPRSTKAFFSSVLGSPLGSGASEFSTTPSWSFAGWGNVLGQLVSLGRSRTPAPPPPPSSASTAPFLSFSVCAPLLLEHLQLAEARRSLLLAHLSSHSGWGRLSCDPLLPTFISPTPSPCWGAPPRIPPSVTPFRSPEPKASLGSRRNRLQNAGARPRCLRAPPVSRPAPAAQTPA